MHHLKFEAMGIYSSLPLLGGAIAGALGGLLNDWFIAKTGNRRWSRSGIAAVGKGLAAVFLLIALVWYNNPYVFCGLLFAVKFFGDWSLATSWGVVTDIGGRATASVFAFNNAVAGIGLIAAPPLFGFLALRYGWPVVFVTVAATYVLCALSWLVIDCTIPVIGPNGSGRDRNRTTPRIDAGYLRDTTAVAIRQRLISPKGTVATFRQLTLRPRSGLAAGRGTRRSSKP